MLLIGTFGGAGRSKQKTSMQDHEEGMNIIMRSI